MPGNHRRKYAVLLAGWSILVAASLAYNLRRVADNTLQTATVAARANVNKDISFRKWAASHGGVYVPPTERTPPNPYLAIPDRDVVTTKGKALTLMNPAYVLREMQNNFGDDYGTRSRITSLKPLNPRNAPDPWETKALQGFEQGRKELLEIQQIDGQPYLRLMLPFVTERDCLKCHAHQGYKSGDIRGGIGTSVSLTTYLADERQRNAELALSHGFIWLIGLAGLGFAYRRESFLDAERKKTEVALRDSEERFRTLAAVAPVGIFRTDAKGDCQYVNPRWCEITGLSLEASKGQGWAQAIHPDDRKRVFTEWYRAAESKQPFRLEYRMMAPDGHTTWVIGQSRPEITADGRIIGHVGTIADITEIKQAQEEIHQLNASLEARVTDRTAQLEAANADLESFSYSVSHDLRAPLRAIDGFAAILREDYAPRLDAEGQRLFQVVSKNAQKMGQLIDDVLAFSRAGRNELQVTRLDMNALVRNVWQELESQRQGRAVELRLADLPAACGDPVAVRQIWQNLLGNAVKFTRERTPAVIEVGGEAGATENVYYVKDNGAGFDPAYVAKLFNMFQRLHGAAEFEGTGVGLAIVKRYIVKHGGRVWADGQPGAGATFWFSLPSTCELAPPPAAE